MRPDLDTKVSAGFSEPAVVAVPAEVGAEVVSVPVPAVMEGDLGTGISTTTTSGWKVKVNLRTLDYSKTTISATQVATQGLEWTVNIATVCSVNSKQSRHFCALRMEI